MGTTSVRTLESARQHARPGETVGAFEGPTDLFILPGYSFQVVDGMVTNFHLPRSSLIMLVSAFAGRERVLQAYETAKNTGYRFYSFGDAMYNLIIEHGRRYWLIVDPNRIYTGRTQLEGIAIAIQPTGCL